MAKADQLKLYRFHGLEFEVSGEEATTDCPFCAAENKLTVNTDTGMFRCFICDAKGNHYNFLRKLWEQCKEDEGPIDVLAKSRGLSVETLRTWGVAYSSLKGQWLVPGFNIKGELTQLYRYAKMKGGKYALLASPKPLSNAIFGVDLYDSTCDTVYLCEGPWDGMRLWEVLRTHKQERSGEIKSTTSKTNNFLKKASVLCVPGCTTFKDSWSWVFRKKKVYIVFDNDHPKKNGKKEQPPASLTGSKLITGKLTAAARRPKNIFYTRWGKEGFNRDLPNGYDIRDHFKEEPKERLEDLLKKFEPAPEEWRKRGETEKKVEPIDCTNWLKLTNTWRKAMNWSEGLEGGLACMLATIVSTGLPGDQLWCKIVSPPSCGKSTLCDAIDISNHVYSQSKMKGFHSGYKSDKDGEEDNSLIVRINNKTLVTKDGDTLLSTAGLENILAEARDVYDGNTSAGYLNGVNRSYSGIRMTWLLCGTASLRALDSTELGARFIDYVIMNEIDRDTEDIVCDMVFDRTDRNMSEGCDTDSPNLADKEMVKAQAMTGGYVNYLRKNVKELMRGVKASRYKEQIIALAKYVAFFRNRPSRAQTEEVQREFAARLTSQYARLAKCLAVVMNKKEVDEKVMVVVRKSAMDTARGITQEIATEIYEQQSTTIQGLATATATPESEIRKWLRFLAKTDVVKQYNVKPKGKNSVRPKKKWKLKPHITELFDYVYEEEEDEDE